MNQKKPTRVYNPFEQSYEKAPDRPVVPQNIPTEIKNTISKSDFTPMNFDKLNSSYQNQDASSLEAVRNQLTPEQLAEREKLQFHKKYKQEEEEYYLQRKQEEEEKKRQEEMEEYEKRKQEAQEQQANQDGGLPQGKVRKNILGGGTKKGNMDIPPAEVKPGKGKS